MILAIIVIFLERRDASATWAWVLVLFFIPGLGFITYIFLGRNLSSRGKLFQWEDQKKIGIAQQISNQLDSMSDGNFPYQNNIEKKNHDLIYMHLKYNDALLTQDNHVDVFTDGKEKFEALLKDIESAEDHIHLQYYIFKKDKVGKKLLDALIKKAKEGVKVRILYDDLGSRRMTRRFFKELRLAGGEVEVFFPSKLRFINLRINFRNHRKLAIIDGKIGYVGGFNVGDEYLGLNPRFGYWRDTHLRIKGGAVHEIQTRFILDWNQASYRHDISYSPSFFPKNISAGDVGVQIVSSGPDSEYEQIKNGYIKMVSSAKKTVWIQTPYFIPDASLLDALRIASLSGVDVRIMIPNKPDHLFVYWATYSYIGEMLKSGVKVYVYDNGFIHSKTIIVDNQIASVGTANIDVRSFRLNFEVNAFIYNKDIANHLTKCFTKDMKLSWDLTLEKYQQRSLQIRFKESISRLLSPIL
jgi:cardiolipin synthase